MPNIEKRILGKSGIEVTKIGLGLWAIGGDEWGEVDDRESLDMIDAAPVSYTHLTLPTN